MPSDISNQRECEGRDTCSRLCTKLWCNLHFKISNCYEDAMYFGVWRM